jgi:hypothetical protein
MLLPFCHRSQIRLKAHGWLGNTTDKEVAKKARGVQPAVFRIIASPSVDILLPECCERSFALGLVVRLPEAIESQWVNALAGASG